MVDLLSFLRRETTFISACLLPAYQVPAENRSTLKGKNLLPRGAKFFPFRVDPFRREQDDFDIVASPLPEVYPYPLTNDDVSG